MASSDAYEHGLGATKAIAIPFTNAIPQYAVLDPGTCTWCGRCASACPTDCIDFPQKPEEIEVRAKSVILTTGSHLTPVDAKPQYGQGKLPNFLTPMQVERLLAPHGPYGRVLRPGDGKIPDSIAFVQCAGSRDLSLGTAYLYQHVNVHEQASWVHKADHEAATAKSASLVRAGVRAAVLKDPLEAILGPPSAAWR